MLGSKIARRILTSFLLLTLTGLFLSGLLLMHYSHDAKLADEQHDLLIHAKVIARMLQTGGYDLSASLEAPIADISAQTGLRITVLDETGGVLADSNRDAERMENHFDRPEVQEAIAKGSGSATRYSQTLGETMLYVAIPFQENDRFGGIIRTATSLRPIETAMRHNLAILTITLAFSFVASVALAIYLARRQLSPILSIIAAARGIMGGDLSRRILLHTGDEFDILIRALNQLTGKLARKIDEARTENEKLNLILETMDNGVLLFDRDGNITEANRRVRDLFHLRAEDLHRHSIHVLGSAILSETANDVLHQGVPKKMHLKLSVLGRPHTFKVYFATFTMREGPAAMAVFHDISLMEELHERQSAFVGNAAHELKTPLTSIRGFAEFLAEDDFKDPETSRHCAAVIQKEAERMDRLVQSLLQLARLESADVRKNIELIPVDAGKVLQDVADELLPAAQKKQQHVDVSIKTTATLLAKADLFGQILRNLLENAIKYTPTGGRIALSCTAGETDVQLIVEDSGIGIDAAHLPYIFDRFYRVDKARARQSGGNGIGLSLVKFLVKLFQGTIHVESAPQKGTRFTLTFPKAQENQA